MGNHKFRFSDMLPNAWFYKLRDMNTTKTHKTSASKKNIPPFSMPRSSFYYGSQSIKVTETYFLDPPRKSTKNTTKRKTIYKPSPKHNISSSTSSTKDNFLEFDFIKSPSSEFDSDYIIDASQYFNEFPSCPNSCICQLNSSAKDIIIDISGNGHSKEFNKVDAGYATISEFDLPPIRTKEIVKQHKQNTNMKTKLATPRRADGNNAPQGKDNLKFKVDIHEPKMFDGTKLENFLRDMEQHFDAIRVQEEDKVTISSMYLAGDAKLWWQTYMAGEPKIDTWKQMKKKLKDQFLPTSKVLVNPASRKYLKLRTNSTKLASKKINGRKSLSLKRRSKPQKESFSTGTFAIVKTSTDPEKDFTESMMEMVVENNIRASKDLENLLACYLSLNSNEYHDLIIKAFQQIWFSLSELHL